MTQPQKSLSSYARVTSPSPSLARPPSGSSVTLPCSPSISPARCTRVLLSTAHHRGRGGGRGPTTHARASTPRRVGAGVTSDVGIDVGPPSLPSLRSCFSLACCSLCFRFSCVRRRWFVLSTCGGGSCAEETGACAAFSLFFFFHGGGLWPAYVPCVWASLDADPVSETARASVDRRAHARARRSGTWCLRSAHRSGRAWPSKKWAPGVGNVGRGVGFESERLG